MIGRAHPPTLAIVRAWTLFLTLALVSGAGAAHAQTHVSCVGDSITFGDGTSAPSKTYPAVLQSLLGAGHAVEPPPRLR